MPRLVGGCARSLGLLQALALAPLLFGAQAFAFIPPGPAVLKHLVHAREDLHLVTLRVEGTVSFFGDAVRQAAAALNLPPDRPETQGDASIAIRFPARCRLDVTTPESTHLVLTEINGKLRADEPQIDALSVALDRVCRIFAPRGISEPEIVDQLDVYLRSLGVDTTQSSLDRQRENVVYVVGKVGPNEPQLWVFKDTHLPARLRFPDANKVLWDLKFVDYDSPFAGAWFPRIIEISHGPDLLARITVLKADNHTSLPERLFNPPAPAARPPAR